MLLVTWCVKVILWSHTYLMSMPGCDFALLYSSYLLHHISTMYLYMLPNRCVISVSCCPCTPRCWVVLHDRFPPILPLVHVLTNYLMNFRDTHCFNLQICRYLPWSGANLRNLPIVLQLTSFPNFLHIMVIFVRPCGLFLSFLIALYDAVYL